MFDLHPTGMHLDLGDPLVPSAVRSHNPLGPPFSAKVKVAAPEDPIRGLALISVQLRKRLDSGN